MKGAMKTKKQSNIVIIDDNKIWMAKNRKLLYLIGQRSEKVFTNLIVSVYLYCFVYINDMGGTSHEYFNS